MKTALLCIVFALGIFPAALSAQAPSVAQRDDRDEADTQTTCRPIAQLPLGLTDSQTMRLNVTCVATDTHREQSCPVTLRFIDGNGDPVTTADPSAPLELATAIPVRGAAFLDLNGQFFVSGAIRRVVRPVVVGSIRDFDSDRLVMNVEVFDSATGKADIRYAFQGCRTLPLAFVPPSQRPRGFTGQVHELSFAPPGITTGESVSLNVACVADPARPEAPCVVVLRYSRFENTMRRRGDAGNPLIAEREVAIEPGAIASFEVPGHMLGATALSRAMFRPSVVGHADMLRRVVTGFEIFDSVTGVASSLYQPPNKVGPIIRR